MPPDTGIVHQVNLEYLAPVIFPIESNRPCGVSRHAGRHRFAYYDDQWPGRCRLGRRRHRSRGLYARPAHLDAAPRWSDSSCEAGWPKAAPPPIWCSPSPRCCARRAWWASSSNFMDLAWRRWRWPIVPPSATWRPNTAQPSGSFPSITRRSIIYGSPIARPNRSRWWKLTPRRRGCFSRPDSPDPEYSDTLELDLSTVVPSMAGPKRPQDRINLPDVKKNFLIRSMPRRRPPSFYKWIEIDNSGWLGGHRRHHQLHQHFKPIRYGRGWTAG